MYIVLLTPSAMMSMKSEQTEAGICPPPCFSEVGWKGDNAMRTSTLVCLTVFAAGLSILSQSEAAEEGLVGYWSFNEGEGNLANDSSGMNNHGELFGNVDWVEGKFGSGLKFSEDRSCVKIEHSESDNLTEQVSIALWAMPEESQPAWGKFVCKQKTDDYPYALQYDDSNRIKGAVQTSNGTVGIKMDTFDEWTHLALVYDGTSLILYKNGEEVVRKPANGKLQQNNLSVTIGSRWESSQSYRGVIDEVRLYNVALSQEEIKKVMESEDGMAVGPSGKLAVTWGMIRTAR